MEEETFLGTHYMFNNQLCLHSFSGSDQFLNFLFFLLLVGSLIFVGQDNPQNSHVQRGLNEWLVFDDSFSHICLL